MVKVKICGITNLKDAIIAEEAGADFIGFVFAKSPRRIEVGKARDIVGKISPAIKVSALFVNEKKENVEKAIRELGRVDLLQFHGDETPDYCQHFRNRKIIKAFRIKDESSLAKIADFKNIDFMLLDTFKETQYGGTGHMFNWDLAIKARGYNIPIFLSGGLNPDNVKDAILKVSPFAVDVSSGVEKEPGSKDPELVKRFVAVAKSA